MLSDSDKRARYDQYGHAGVDPNFGAGGAGGFNGAGFGFDDLGDIFSSFFGGGFGGGRQANPNAPRRGEDIQARVTISFEEAAKGCKRTVEVTRVDTCPDCHGSGAKAGTSPKTCPDCGGRGFVNVQQRTAFGVISTQKSCPKCGGRGRVIDDPCQKCRGSGRVSKRTSVEVNIPAGIDDRQIFNVSGAGNSGVNGGPKGDLKVAVLSDRTRSLSVTATMSGWSSMSASLRRLWAIICVFLLLTVMLNSICRQAHSRARSLTLKAEESRMSTAEARAISS